MTIRELFSKIREQFSENSDLIQEAGKSIGESILDIQLEKAMVLIIVVGILIALLVLWPSLDSPPDKPTREKKEEAKRDGMSLKDWFWFTVGVIAWVFLIGLIAFYETHNVGIIIGAFIMLGIFLAIRPAWLRKIDKQKRKIDYKPQ